MKLSRTQFCLLSITSLLFAACLTSCSSESKGGRVLRFSAIPDQGKTELKIKFDAVAKYLSAKLGIPVEYRPSSDYSVSVEAFKKGEVHFAWFGGLTGVQAHEEVPGAKAVASGFEDKDFVSYFIAHKRTGIERSDTFPMGLAGKTFVFGPKKSTSGRLMPEHFMRENTGKAPNEFLASLDYSTGHNKTAELVQAGSFDAGVLNFQVYDDLANKGTIDRDTCRVIWKTPSYFDYNITVRPDLDKDFGEGTTNKLVQCLLNMHEASNGKELCAAFGRSRLVACSNDDLKAIRDTAIALQLLTVKK